MPMTKAEKARMEELLTQAALRETADPGPPDVPPPKSGNGLSKGWLPIGRGSFPRVERACSSSVYHGIGRDDKTNSQNPRHLYSTKLLALRALRREVEIECSLRLRSIDKMIEEAETEPQK